ncbi:MAG: PIN domain nuclease [Chloroflexi bacterium HGW-Chloroflexi-5]|jgi:predicted nucleic acid-binding protein|nr:MAG: PIN domain nuclease [Chloroflexi bacterium HGW-Chloroflexi-5]
MNNNTFKVLFDTNVLVYLFDSNEIRRQNQACKLLNLFKSNNLGCLSTQCLSEFVNVTTRGYHPILTKDKMYLELLRFQKIFSIIPINYSIVLEAARGFKDHNLSFFDAQIWAAAKLNQIPVIFSEDFQDGRTLEGVRFVNPFSKAFDISQWG